MGYDMILGKEDGMHVEEWRNVKEFKNESGADIDG
jgi:hypothetical protein